VAQEREGSPPYSQQFSADPYPELVESNPYPPPNLPKIHSDPILPPTLRSSEWSLSFGLSHPNVSPLRATFPAHLIRFDLCVEQLRPNIIYCSIIFANRIESATFMQFLDKLNYMQKHHSNWIQIPIKSANTGSTPRLQMQIPVA
jgi:hypothetical protein